MVPTFLSASCFPLLTWVVVICWDETASRCVFAPVRGETGVQRKKISARRGSLVPSSPLGALSEVSRPDKRKWVGKSEGGYPESQTVTTTVGTEWEQERGQGRIEAVPGDPPYRPRS